MDSNPTNSNAQNSQQRFHDIKPKWQRGLEAIGILAGISYAIVTWYMWRDSHKNFTVDQRAWLTIDSSFPNDTKEGTSSQCTLILKNTGKTPAMKPILYEFVVLVVKNAEQIQFDYPAPHFSGFVGSMPPNSVMIAQVAKSENPFQLAPFTKSESDDLLNGRSYLAIYGRGKYNDIFGETHWFHFCNWKTYYAGAGTFAAGNCTNYTDTGDGELPELLGKK